MAVSRRYFSSKTSPVLVRAVSTIGTSAPTSISAVKATGTILSVTDAVRSRRTGATAVAGA